MFHVPIVHTDIPHSYCDAPMELMMGWELPLCTAFGVRGHLSILRDASLGYYNYNRLDRGLYLLLRDMFQLIPARDVICALVLQQVLPIVVMCRACSLVL